MTLDLIIAKGNLKQAFAQVDASTILHSAEIMNERRKNKEVRRGFWTADFPLYVMDGKAPILYLAKGCNNLVFQNLDAAIEQIRKDNNYKPSQEDANKVIKADSTLRIPLANLKLELDNDEYGHFEINTKKYDKLNPTQKVFAERVYGKGKDFAQNMEMLNGAGISTASVYSLNPNYVKKHAKENPIARVCWLSDFVLNSYFVAINRDVGSCYGALRGVRSVVAEGGAQKNDPLANVKAALGSKTAFEYEGQIYVPVAKSSGIKI